METSGYSSEGSALLNNSLHSNKYSIAYDDPKAAAKLASASASASADRHRNRRSLSIESLSKKSSNIHQCSSSTSPADQVTSAKLSKNINVNNNNNNNRNLNRNYNNPDGGDRNNKICPCILVGANDGGLDHPNVVGIRRRGRTGGYFCRNSSFVNTVLMPIVCLVCVGCTVFFTIRSLRTEERLNELDRRWRTVVNLSPLLEKLANNDMVSVKRFFVCRAWPGVKFSLFFFISKRARQ